MSITASSQAVDKAIAAAGQFLESLGKFDLMAFTPEEFAAFIKAIADEVANEDVTPF